MNLSVTKCTFRHSDVTIRKLQLEMRVCKTLCPQLYACPNLAACMIHFIQMKWNLISWRNCPVSSVLTSIQKQNTDKLEMEWKFHSGVILSKFDQKSWKVDQVIIFSAPTSIPIMKALA